MNKLITALSLSILFGGCCNEDFIIPENSQQNDLRANAIDVTSLFDADCSTLYSTVGATADGGLGSCWLDQTNAGDVWFKITGQPPYGYVSLYIQVGGTEGTQEYSQLVLWDTDGVTELDCDGYDSASDDDLFLFYGSLVIGEEYYFSVSVPEEANKGTFTICLTTSD